MLRKITVIVILVVGIGWAFLWYYGRNQLPSTAEEALRKGTDFQLLSLDPSLPVIREIGKPPVADDFHGSKFHGWKVLGSTAVADAATRSQLVDRFNAAVAENDGLIASCFNPRHGVKVTHNAMTYDFVICFECYHVKWYIDDGPQKLIPITASAQPIFDEVLKRANIPLAKWKRR